MATLKVSGAALVLSSASGTLAIDSLFTARAEVWGADGDLLGQPFELTLEAELVLRGIVTSVASEMLAGERHLTLELGPEVFPLSLGESSAVFLQKSAVDVVKAVLEAAGIAASATKWSLSGTHAARPTITQRAESDWSFVERLLAEEGIYYFFDHGPDATVLTFADNAQSAADAGSFPYRMEHGMRPPGTTWVSHLMARAELGHDSVLVRDRDPLKPALALEGKAGGKTARTYYDWPGRFQVPADGKTRATQMLEALQGDRVVRRGKSGAPRVRCGTTFTITHHPTDARNEKLLCTGQSFELLGGVGTPTYGFTAVPASTPLRPLLRAPRRRPLGPETVTVTGAASAEVDADANGAVVCQPLWDRTGKKDEKASARVRTMQAVLAESVMLPRVGFAVLVAHHDDDVDRPWVYARQTDGAHPPPYKQPDSMTRSAWQTLTSPSDGSSSELRFEDKSGEEEVFWNAAKDMQVTIGDNAAWTIGNLDTLVVTGKRDVTIGGDDKLTVTSDQTVAIKGKEAVSVDGSRSITVKGKEHATVSGSRTAKTDKDQTRDVAGKLSLTVGEDMSLASKKGVTREVLKKQTEKSGGAWTTKSDAGLAVTVMGDGKESVTGARSETGKKGVQTLVAGDMSESIGAGYTISAQGALGESAKGKLAVKAAAGISATAQAIEIEGKSEITIVCGGSTLTIKSSGVEVKSAAIICTGPMIVNDGATVKHNP